MTHRPSATAPSASSASAFQNPTGACSLAIRSPSSASDGTATPRRAQARAAPHDCRSDRGDPSGAVDECAGQEPEDEKRHVHDPAAEPLPGAVAGDRPGDRDACPGRQPDRGADGERSGAIEPTEGEEAEQRSADPERSRHDCGETDRGERVVARASPGEDGRR